jgi:cytochrome c oxidase assembly factor 5
MASSCGDIREELIECIKRSDCMAKSNFSFHECVKQPKEAVGEKCVLLRQALFECKRGQVRVSLQLH